ncbi:hypothetical protein [Oceanospirillum sediminis]|uniref:Uncharacterized protein n=1 Tax=Oceanospirillum sediminis TaxID=2760088 RepID=A0A839IME6_9GAMM|nr:hypothetical protein [Oceanospirillum sediminis]MBB1485874.1 hypothetical protein [Oceanospirillum sediminis]
MNIFSGGSFLSSFLNSPAKSLNTQPVVQSVSGLNNQPPVTGTTTRQAFSTAETMNQPPQDGGARFGFRTHTNNMSPEKAERVQTLLSRLDDEQNTILAGTQHIHGDELFSDDFLTMVEEMDDEQLSQLINTLDGFNVNPGNNFFYRDPPDLENFIQTLAQTDEETRDRILDKTSELSEAIYHPDGDFTYDSMGISPQVGSVTANPLHHFISAVTQSPDSNQFMDKLEQFDEQQQNQLLNVFGWDHKQGERLMNALEGKSEETQGALLSFLSDLTENGAVPLTIKQQVAGSDMHTGSVWLDGQKPGTAAALLTIDNNSESTVDQMLDETLTLLDQYQFSDEQLIQMTDDLKGMERSDQRAYLTISKTGLETLFSASGNTGNERQPIDMSEHQQAFDIVDSVRQDSHARDLVFRSRVGEQVGLMSSVNSEFYELKSKEDSLRDVRNTVAVLTRQAMLGPQSYSNQESRGSAEDTSVFNPLEKTSLQAVNIDTAGPSSQFSRSLNQMMTRHRDHMIQLLQQISDNTNPVQPSYSDQFSLKTNLFPSINSGNTSS